MSLNRFGSRYFSEIDRRENLEMAHEIHADDKAAFFRQGAWHGLGTIVQDKRDPMEMLKVIEADYTIGSWPAYAMGGPDGKDRVVLENYRANIREDNKRVLGVVGKGYEIVQNKTLAEFANALAENGDKIVVESAGTIRHGAKIWFLLRAESFSVRKDDEVRPYILVSNGHDGNTQIRCTPTSIRVVCSNTLHAVLGYGADVDGGKAKLGSACYAARHTGNVMDKVAEAKAALELYGRSLKDTRQLIMSLDKKNIDKKGMEQFFMECYSRDFAEIPTKPANKQEEAIREKARKAFRGYKERFETEGQQFGKSSYWTAFNAYTGYIQNDRPLRIKGTLAKQEQRQSLKLFGDDADRTSKAFATALAV